MGRAGRVAAVCAVLAAVLAAVAPHMFWKHAAFAWYQIGYTLGLQHGCFDQNPLLAALFRRAEDAELGAPLPLLDIPVIQGSDYTWQKLTDLSENWARPVVVRGLFDKSTLAMREWDTLDYFIENYPGGEITTFAPYTPQEWHLRGPQCGKDNSDWPQPVPFTTIKEAAEQGNGFRTVPWYPETEDSIKAVSELDRHKLDGPPLMLQQPGIVFNTPPDDFGEGGWMSTDWHAALGSAFPVALQQSKTWDLVESHNAHLMRPTVWYDGFATRGFVPEEQLQRIPRYRVTIQPGDALFIPPWTWHRVWTDQPGLTVLASWRLNLWQAGFRNNLWYMSGVFRAVALRFARGVIGSTGQAWADKTISDSVVAQATQGDAASPVA